MSAIAVKIPSLAYWDLPMKWTWVALCLLASPAAAEWVTEDLGSELLASQITNAAALAGAIGSGLEPTLTIMRDGSIPADQKLAHGVAYTGIVAAYVALAEASKTPTWPRLRNQTAPQFSAALAELRSANWGEFASSAQALAATVAEIDTETARLAIRCVAGRTLISVLDVDGATSQPALWITPIVDGHKMEARQWAREPDGRTMTLGRQATPSLLAALRGGGHLVLASEFLPGRRRSWGFDLTGYAPVVDPVVAACGGR